MATMAARDHAKPGGKGGLFVGLLVGLLLGALLLAPKARAPLLAKINEAEAARSSLQESLDKLKQDSDAVKKELDGVKASQEARTKEVETLAQQLKECQDKAGSDLKQKVADAKAKLDEAQKHLADISA